MHNKTCVIIYTLTVNCPIRELDLYHITSQFIIELPLNTRILECFPAATGTGNTLVFPAAGGNTSFSEFHAKKSKMRLSTMAEQEIVWAGEFSPVLPPYSRLFQYISFFL